MSGSESVNRRRFGHRNGNRGDQVHDEFLEHGDQQTVAICDQGEDHLDPAANELHYKYRAPYKLS